ncbi:hypothetical protein [Actinophytocola sp.]|uniref:hypothetical protein n=1 Tax=Actinophytocola sp. TaxID=1872138 RepID=UPI003D6B1301
MTHEQAPPPPGYDADEGAFAGFTRGFRPLADHLTTDPLATHASLHGDAFSRVGNEVGLADAIRNATQRQHDRIRGLATNTDAMADAVDNTWTNYRTTEDDHERAIRRAAGEQT